jgi:hypothetical protein
LGPTKYGQRLRLDVVKGNYTLSSGDVAEAPSTFVAVPDSWLTFPAGLAINVTGGQIILNGKTYAEGTELIVNAQGSLVRR